MCTVETFRIVSYVNMPQNAYLEFFLPRYLCPPCLLFHIFFAVVARNLLFGIFFLLLCCKHMFCIYIIRKCIYLSTFWCITINKKTLLYNDKLFFLHHIKTGLFLAVRKELIKGRCGSKNENFLKNYRFFVFTCFVKISTSTILKKKNLCRESTGNALKLRLKSTRWLSKGRKCVIFEHLAADNAPLLAIVDRMRRRTEPHSSNSDGFPRCCNARNNKEKRAFAAFFERRDWLLNHVVRIGSRHWPLRACVCCEAYLQDPCLVEQHS